MKYVCLTYADERRWTAMTPQQQQLQLDACIAYDDELRRNGQRLSGETLQRADQSVTLRQGEVIAASGEPGEATEHLVGVLVLDARDFNHAIQLMARHPGARLGRIEIRASADLDARLSAGAPASRRPLDATYPDSAANP